MKTITILTPAGTTKFAHKLAQEVVSLPAQKGAVVVALSGELGAGKTTFTKAFLKALGVREAVTSPTFILFRPYPLKLERFGLAYHIDCYRLEDPKELLQLGLKDMLKNPKCLVVIEWAERVKKFLPKNAIWLSIQHGTKKNVRKVSITH